MLSVLHGCLKIKDRQGLEVVRATKGMKLLHLNIRSLLAHWEELQNSIFKCDLDVIIFSETWLHDGIPDNLVIHSGYNLI